jgi:phage FluMu gp28-like protein
MIKALESYFFKYQLDYLADRSRIKLLEKSRRIGGSYMQAFEDVEDIVTRREYTPGRPVERIYFASKDELAGREYIEYCYKWAKIFNIAAKELGTEIVDEKTGAKASVIEFSNGGKIYALSSSPTAFNSKGGKIVWDEAALHKDQRQMWAGAKPASLWGYPIRILSTHKGKKTLFYKFCEDVKKGKLNWSHHIVTLPRAVNDGLADKILGRKLTAQERLDWVEQQRKDCNDDDIFNEDFLCLPVDSTTAYFSYELIESCTRDKILLPFEELKNCKGPLYAGWDIARYRDMSVVIVLEKSAVQYIVRHIRIMDKTPTPLQKNIADEFLRLPNLMRMCLDQTGMGIPITEDMQKSHGVYRAEGVTFTNQVKEVLATSLKNAFEDIAVIVPDDYVLKESMHSIQKIVTAAGNTRYDADRTDQTGHADMFWALALAYHAAVDPSTGPAWACSTSPIFTSTYSDYNSSMLKRY